MIPLKNNPSLSPNVLEQLCRVFKQHPLVDQVKLYGSRAKQTHSDRSDIDLAVFGRSLDRFKIAALLMDLEDTAIVNKIDLQAYSDIRNDALRDHIDRVGLVIYTKAGSLNNV